MCATIVAAIEPLGVSPPLPSFRLVLSGADITNQPPGIFGKHRARRRNQQEAKQWRVISAFRDRDQFVF